MLSLVQQSELDDMGFSRIGQSLICHDNQKILRLCTTIKIKGVALNNNHHCKLVFYIRDNGEGRSEAGIVYEPGPENKHPNEFPREMIRFFADHESECFELGENKYLDWVAQQSFRCQ